jgi:hypothetical protein
MNEVCADRDLVKRGRTMWLLWGLPVATMLATGLLIGSGWIVTVSWTMSLVAMGVACVVNARSCGRVHCYFTGPFLLLMAGVSVLHGLQVLSLGPDGWSHIGTVLLVGGVLLCLVPEWIWGRYRA